MHELAPQQESKEQEKSGEQLYGELAATRDNLMDFDDFSFTRDNEDRRELLGYDNSLALHGGGDGIYGHLVTLRSKSQYEGKELIEFFTINTYRDKSLQVVAERREEGEPTESYLVTLGEDGSTEGYPTDEQDMFKKKTAAESLSPEEAAAVVEGVMNRFNEERQRRIDIVNEVG